jgi:type IV pilus assembly protein PilV
MRSKFKTGFTLIEVLVTMAIVSCALLGVAGIIVSGMKANLGSQSRSQATWLANDIIDRMRGNRGTAEDVSAPYNIAVTDPDPADTATIPKQDLVAWRTALRSALPSGTGGVSIDAATKKVTVTIQWDDSRIVGGLANQKFVVESRL